MCLPNGTKNAAEVAKLWQLQQAGGRTPPNVFMIDGMATGSTECGSNPEQLGG